VIRTTGRITGLVLISVLSAIFTVSCSVADNPEPRVSLHITFPENEAIVTTNLLKIRGGTSPADTAIHINGIQATVDTNDSSFSAYIELTEGDNEISVVATHGDESASRLLSVRFEPAPWIDYRWPDLPEGVDYTRKPIHIAGTISDPDLPVVVYATADRNAEVPPGAVDAAVDGTTFEADVLLAAGPNLVCAMVEKGGNTAIRGMLVEVTGNGSVIYTTGKSDGTSLVLYYANIEPVDPEISLRADTTERFDIRLVTSQYPRVAPMEQVFFAFRGADRPHAPLPDGITIRMEPPAFTAYQNTDYTVSMVIATSEDMIPGTYHVRCELLTASGKNNARETMTITVVE